MEYQKWLGRAFVELQQDDTFTKFFAFTESEEMEDRLYLTNHFHSIEAAFNEDNKLDTIFLHSAGHHGFSGFKEQLPLNLSFDLTEDETEKLLGIPPLKGGDDYSLIYGITPKWCKYFYSDFDLHIQYRGHGESIEMITMMKQGLKF